MVVAVSAPNFLSVYTASTWMSVLESGEKSTSRRSFNLTSRRFVFFSEKVEGGIILQIRAWNDTPSVVIKRLVDGQVNINVLNL